MIFYVSRILTFNSLNSYINFKSDVLVFLHYLFFLDDFTKLLNAIKKLLFNFADDKHNLKNYKPLECERVTIKVHQFRLLSTRTWFFVSNFKCLFEYGKMQNYQIFLKFIYEFPVDICLLKVSSSILYGTITIHFTDVVIKIWLLKGCSIYLSSWMTLLISDAPSFRVIGF